MKSKTGMGLVGVILLAILLVALLSFITGSVVPFLKKAPETGEKALIEAKILPEEYYKISVRTASRGFLKFQVIDPQGNHITDFNPITGYQVSEDGIPALVQDVSAFQNLYFAVAVDPNLVSECSNVLSEINKIKFNNTFVSIVSPGENPVFLHKSVATCATHTFGNFWTTLKNAVATIPGGKADYSFLILISNGECTAADCNNNEIVGEAVQILANRKLNSILLLTSNSGNCKTNTVLSAVGNAARIQTDSCVQSGGTCYYKSDNSKNVCGEFALKENVLSAEQEVSQISLRYKPIASTGTHKIAVRATKRPFTGRVTTDISYGAV